MKVQEEKLEGKKKKKERGGRGEKLGEAVPV